MNRLSIQFGSLLTLLAAAFGLVAGQEESIAKPLDPVAASRKNFQPANLLDFDAFKSRFHKKYNTCVEEQMRRKLYMARSIRTFNSAVRYRQGLSDIYLKLNHMSDWTPNEREQMFLGSQNDELKLQSNVQAESSMNIYPKSNEYELTDESLFDVTGPNSDDQVYIDHRQSGCFFNTRNQGKCGSCYIFVTVPAYEWKHCKETGKLVAFSEQYFLDCGIVFGEKREKPPNWAGCNGGREFLVVDFAQEYGLDLRRKYPYRGWQDDCPFEEGTSQDNIGYLKVPGIGRIDIPWEKLEATLQESPIMVSLFLTKTFPEYGGGVDSGEGCGKEGDTQHGMLLIGHGRENGADYWILRNSFGNYWGEDGHYRLSKSSRCFIHNHAPIVLTGSFNTSFVNPNYDGRKVRQHYRKYLLNDAKPRFSPKDAPATTNAPQTVESSTNS